MNHMRFREIGGECTSKEWIADEIFNNGEFDFRIVLQIMSMREASDQEEEAHEFAVFLVIVAPTLAGAESSDDAAALETFEKGYYARVWYAEDDSPLKLMLEAVRMAPQVEGLIGCYLDRPVNRIGTTGWEALRDDHQVAWEGAPLENGLR